MAAERSAHLYEGARLSSNSHWSSSCFSGCVVTTSSRRGRSGPHSHGYSGKHARRAEAGLHEHPSRRPKRGGRLLDLLPFPTEVFGEADAAEPFARSGFEKVSDERSHPFGPDEAVEVESVSVVKDDRDPFRDDLAADGTCRVRLGHRGTSSGAQDGSKSPDTWQYVLLPNTGLRTPRRFLPGLSSYAPGGHYLRRTLTF